ncbi:FKBP-type peptidyl-prolyl cis-trans isomerase [Mucilaginibacter glaciei]|uniref:Peptidyl-prolyl cis-trans isomerase n=1 Tax=Mucilaginibacter glaciei TaxID=2772109 RepID=A0A926S1U6_9SPHI|nr:FKBP-type peptidyl-prolyl cis-trans isomerase [Mucilaginibacter glaciei]MBD1393443.1 FKBP-type peptidyl-prolyl cis-trans isomerase [Mucilaginibacter glaciei]
MKKYILTLSFLVIAFASCKKGDSFDAAAQATKDDAAIQTYLKANPNITATKDPSGVYYQVVTPGTGANPTASSAVTVNYTGSVLNGGQFATALNLANSPLTGLIAGWQIGIPKVKAGGRILLIIPSAYGYGNNSPAAAIPANSVLIFTIDLLSFQ